MSNDLYDQEADAERVYETPDPLGVPVDRPAPRPTAYANVVARRDLPRRPIVPAALRSREQRRQLASWAARFGLHTATYHATRAPKYAAKMAVWSPYGLGRGIARLVAWTFDHEAHAARQDAANRNDVTAYLSLSRQRDKRVVVRLRIAGLLVVLATVVVVLLLTVAPWWWRWVALAGVVPALAWYGRPVDRPIVDRVTVGETFIKLTADMTRAALVTCGVGIKDPSAVKFVHDIGRDGPGWLAQVALPPGIVATDVIDKRDRLAGGLRLPIDQTWPETVKGEHPGRLNIFVSDRPVSAMRQPTSPLLGDIQTDYFQPFPYGADIRLRPMTWSLAERNSLFGGMPGSGKSLAARNVLLGAVLDPLVITAISELKGSGDYDMFEALCPRGLYICGADDASIRASLRIIEWLHHECEVRPPIIAEYARQGLNTVKKLNRAMAERDERLHPIVAMFDEYQELNAHSEVGKYASGMLLSAIKRARALGIHIIIATQRFDKDAMPKAISSLVTNRAALAVPAQPETDMILGTSAYRTGARPTAFVPDEDSGWMVRAGFSSSFETIRAAYIDDKQAEQICARALAMRNGVDAPAGARIRARNLAEDVRSIWPKGQTGLWLADILAALQRLDETYQDMDNEALSAALRSCGVAPVQIHRKIEGKGVTRYGVKLDDLERRLAAKTATAELED